MKMKTKKLSVAIAHAVGAGALLSVTAGGAIAQEKVEKIEVTGSSIKRIEGETALPVTVITRDQLEKQGISSAADFLDRLQANNGGGYNSTLALGDAARPGFAGASLRALGANNTLVLLNGRRLAVYAFDGGGVNLNSIPFAAVERVEILRDGASAIYGTDAIGGVINFITRKDYRGLDLRAGGSQPKADGGGDTKDYSASFGYGDLARQRFNVWGSFSFRDQERLRAIDRNFANTVRRPDLFVPAAFRFSSNSFPATVLTNNIFASPAGPLYSATTGLRCIEPASFGLTPTDNRCRYDYVSQIDIIPDIESKSFMGRGTFQINANTSAFAEYFYTENEYTFRVSQTPASEATTFAGAPLLLPASSQFYPRAWLQSVDPSAVGQPLNIYYRSIEAGPRTNFVEEEQSRFTVGIEGVLGKWDYAAAYSKAENKADESYIGGNLLESRLLPAFATGLINPFGPNTGAGLQALLATQFIGLVRTSKSERNTFDVKASTELMQMANGPLGIAVGAEISKVKFNDQPQAVLNAGDIIGSGGNQLPVRAERDVDALFAEASIPLLKSVEAQVAVRYDKYSDFGNTTNPKVAIRWQPNTSVLFRASAGRGFRAPTLPDLFAPTTQTNSGGIYDDPLYDTSQAGVASRCAVQFNPNFCAYQATVRQGGNTGLQPEKSSQWTVGMLFEPTRDVSFSIDYFVINQRDQIGIISADTKYSDYIANFNRSTRTSSSIYAADIRTRTDTATGATVVDFIDSRFQNLGRQVTKGVDISVKAKLATTPVGTFRLNIDATYLDEQSSKLPGQSDFVNAVGQYATFGAVSRFKHVTNFQWEYRSFAANLFYNWQQGYLDQNDAGVSNPNHRVGNYEIWDFSATYSGIKNLKATVGMRNIFDRDPPASNQNAYFHVGYDPTYTDPRGRQLFGNVSYSFK